MPQNHTRDRVYQSLMGHQVSFLLTVAWIAEALTTVNLYGGGFLNNPAIYGLHGVRLAALAVILVAMIVAIATQHAKTKSATETSPHQPTSLHIIIYLIKASIPLWLLTSMIISLPIANVAMGFSVILTSAICLTIIVYGQAALKQKKSISEAPDIAQADNRKASYKTTLSNLAIELSMLVCIGIGCVFLITLHSHPLFVSLAATLMMVEMAFRAYKMLYGGRDVFQAKPLSEASSAHLSTATRQPALQQRRDPATRSPAHQPDTPDGSKLMRKHSTSKQQ